MNTKITKYKNYTSADLINNRLTKLEKLLQRVIEISGDGAKINNGSLISAEVPSSQDYISGVLLSGKSNLNRDNVHINQSINSFRRVKNSVKSGDQGLILSHGQIIAEIALAITRFGQRNS